MQVWSFTRRFVSVVSRGHKKQNKLRPQRCDTFMHRGDPQEARECKGLPLSASVFNSRKVWGSISAALNVTWSCTSPAHFNDLHFFFFKNGGLPSFSSRLPPVKSFCRLELSGQRCAHLYYLQLAQYFPHQVHREKKYSGWG